jgi:DNA-binding MarR family transcriptional regulator
MGKNDWTRIMPRSERGLHRLIERADPGTLSVLQWEVLSAVREGKTCCKTIAPLIESGHDTTGHILTQLEEKGYITRPPHIRGGAIRTITLTESGRLALDEFAAKLRQSVESRLSLHGISVRNFESALAIIATICTPLE